MTVGSERPRLELDPYRHGTRCPVHSSHRIAIVGEAPGPNTDPGMAFYPYPERSAAGRLKALLGWDRREYLTTFARSNLLDEYPGSSFPIGRARAQAEPTAQRLAPRPLLLMGRGVAMAFSFPHDRLLVWEDYLLGVTLVRAAVVPHTSGRNLWYNDPANREAARAFIQKSCEDLGCLQDVGG